MGRIGLIGENSNEFVEKIIDIWNEDKSVVLIDWRIPLETAIGMLEEAEVEFCYIDSELLVTQKIDCRKGFFKTYTVRKREEYSPVLENVIEKYRKSYEEKEAIVLYSSGTTGKCKGIRLTHKAITSNADAIRKYMGIDKNDCIGIVKALTHSATFVGELLVGLISGAEIILGPTIVSPRVIMKYIARYQVSIMCLNPTLLQIYTKVVKGKQNEISALKKIYISGAILDDSLMEKARKVFYPVQLFNVYGLSEAGPRVSAQREDCAHGSSVGKPIDGVEVTIRNENGNNLEANVRGRICVKTPYQFEGYLSGEKKVMYNQGEWLETGDLGYIDSFGELHVVGRVDDLIILDSHKIYPSDVERVIKSSTQIEECVVTKCKKRNGEGYTIVCFYTGEKALEEEQWGILKSILAIYEIPRRFVYVDQIPKSNNGKINRSNLVYLYENERKKDIWNS